MKAVDTVLMTILTFLTPGLIVDITKFPPQNKTKTRRQKKVSQV